MAYDENYEDQIHVRNVTVGVGCACIMKYSTRIQEFNPMVEKRSKNQVLNRKISKLIGQGIDPW